MKKNYFILFFTLISLLLTAQETTRFSRHFVSFRTGYSIPVSNSQVGSPRSEVGKTYLTTQFDNNNLTSYSEKNTFGSRGSGLNFSLGYGYMITKNFSFEIDFNYLYTLGFNDAFWDETVDGKRYFATQESQTSMFRALPMFGVYANENLIIRPYAKFGLIVPLFGGTTVNLNIDDETGRAFNDLMPVIDNTTFEEVNELLRELALAGIFINEVPTTTDIKAVTSGSFSIGFMGRLGGEYQFKNVLDGKLKLFAEMEMQMLTVKANQTKIKSFYSTVSNEGTKSFAESQGIKTEFRENEIPEILLTTDYLNEITETSNTSFETKNPDGTANPNYKRDQAFEQLTFRDSYNAFAFLVGLKYNF